MEAGVRGPPVAHQAFRRTPRRRGVTRRRGGPQWGKVAPGASTARPGVGKAHRTAGWRAASMRTEPRVAGLCKAVLIDEARHPIRGPETAFPEADGHRTTRAAHHRPDAARRLDSCPKQGSVARLTPVRKSRSERPRGSRSGDF